MSKNNRAVLMAMENELKKAGVLTVYEETVVALPDDTKKDEDRFASEKFRIAGWLLAEHNKKVFNDTPVETKMILAGGLADHLKESMVHNAEEQGMSGKELEEFAENAGRLAEKAAKKLILDNPGTGATKPISMVPAGERTVKTLRKFVKPEPLSEEQKKARVEQRKADLEKYS